MHWLPAPTDFRAALKAARAVNDPDERLQLLRQLVAVRLDFLEVIQVDKALQDVEHSCRRRLPSIRLAVLASNTAEHLLPAIRVAALRRGVHVETYVGPYGQFRQQVLDSSSPLYEFEPDTVLFALSAQDLVAPLPLSSSAEDVDAAISAAVSEMVTLWREIRTGLEADVIQQSFIDTSEPVFGSHDRLVPGAPRWIVRRLNDRVAEAASSESILLLDLYAAQLKNGLDHWFDVARWLQGKIAIALQAAPLYGELLARLIAARLGYSKKCLVFDLDNTLWGGVIGDDGLEGIVLGEGSAAGEAHLALQRYAKLLQERGILLAVCSKNEMDIAERAIREHPEMLLQRSDFAAFVANWADKAVNLRAIAAQLNLGLDSLVFVDDNPVERARIRESLPMVAVPELPADVAGYVRCIADAGYFESVSFTVEDQARASQYAANIVRDAARESAQSVDDFLSGLEMRVSYGPVTPVDLPRVTQLFGKTNQFNTTTRRFSLDEVSRFAADPKNIALVFRLVDRFGDNGLVSVIILCPSAGEQGALEIVNWVMSCRVFGRQLEEEVINIAVEAASKRGARRLSAEFIPTSRNKVICGLYEQLGFSKVEESRGEDAATRWTLDIAEYKNRPTFIRREARTT